MQNWKIGRSEEWRWEKQEESRKKTKEGKFENLKIQKIVKSLEMKEGVEKWRSGKLEIWKKLEEVKKIEKVENWKRS